MAGLVPAIHVLLYDCIIEIVPSSIIGDDQANPPCARPMFDIVLALNGAMDIFKPLEIYAPL